MTEYILITKRGCAGCDDLKEHIMTSGISDEIEVIDVETVNGLAWAAMAERVGAPVPYMISTRHYDVIDDFGEMIALVDSMGGPRD